MPAHTLVSSVQKLPFKLAAIDLDDTLLGADKRVSALNLAAVKRLQEAGVEVIIASGRLHDDCLAYHDLLDISGPIISCQGALVLHPKTAQILHQKMIDKDLTKRIVEEGEKFGATIVFYSEKGVCSNTDKDDSWTTLYERATGRKMRRANLLDFGESGIPYKIQWFHGQNEIQRMHLGISPEISKAADVFNYNNFVIEFLCRGVSKGEAIAKVAQEYGFHQHEVVCFGDAHNDISMLTWAGLGVAMDHAHDEVKAAATLSGPEGELNTALARAIDMVFERY
jgi:Cof subfamily protein (haloacid dehalogenase superfamily)